MITKTKKCGFKVNINQFHHSVSDDFQDESEIELINIFEDCCLQLKDVNKKQYSMIELGSNQCYYSLLFKHILGINNTLNMMVEPHPPYMAGGKAQFELNNVEGVFYDRSIGSKWMILNEEFKVQPITLEEVLTENILQELDVLHSDINGSEMVLLNANEQFFKEGKVKFIFLLTHSSSLHNQCKEFFKELEYSLIYEVSSYTVGSDSLLVFSRN
jgi:hypothetical protein